MVEPAVLRDWHRLFGLLLADFFTDSPFVVEVERDLSQQQQFLDVVIVRRGQGAFADQLPDGLADLADHNLLTFKSHHETLDAWALKELLGHYVAYRKLASVSPSALLPEENFRLYAVCARFPQQLAAQVPWREQQAGVYNCRWGLDEVRVVVPGQLPHEPHNAPLHLFSAAPAVVGFGQLAYRQRSPRTSRLLRQLFERFREEGFTMAFTWEDFERQYIKDHFPQLTREERQEVLQALPTEERLAGLTPEQVQRYLDQLKASRPSPSRKQRRKKG